MPRTLDFLSRCYSEKIGKISGFYLEDKKQMDSWCATKKNIDVKEWSHYVNNQRDNYCELTKSYRPQILDLII